MNIYSDTHKRPRSITIAENWKAKQIKQILTVRDEMISNNIDLELIKVFLEEQYQQINQKYDTKIKKYLENQTKIQNKHQIKDIKNKRNKAINLLSKNKLFFEKNGYNSEYIKKYTENQFKYINENYTVDQYNVYDLTNVNFID